MTELRSDVAYIEHFAEVVQKTPESGAQEQETPRGDWLKGTHQLALDIRKFEIELYWKRANYFWTLIAATFAGFFALATRNEEHPRLVFLVSCIGVVLSVGWYFVNRGSKYWQENWERHVDVLENTVVGPLYKTTIAHEEYWWLHLHRGYPYSVSKINQLISLFVVLIWIGLAVLSFPEADYQERFREVSSRILAAGTAIVVILLALLGKTGAEGKPRNVNFRVSPLGPIGEEQASNQLGSDPERRVPRRKYLQAVLLVAGIAALLLYPLMVIWPSGWAWTPAQHEYQQMIVGIYAVLGVFLIRASREPEAHRSLIWFTVWSSLVHGGIMAVHAVLDPTERGHLIGDIPALFAVAIALAMLTPRGRATPGPQS